MELKLHFRTPRRFLVQKTLGHKINGPVVWVIGGPGSGKGTQCKKIVAKYGFTHLSSGDLLRAKVELIKNRPAVASGSDRGKELNDIIKRGELVPLTVILDLIREAMMKVESPKGFLIDGYPREKEQGIQFEKQVAPVNIILFFDASEDTLRKRLLHRGLTSDRVDDKEEFVKSRLRTFNTHNNQLVKFYADKIKKINADRATEEIFAEVQTHLDPLVQ